MIENTQYFIEVPLVRIAFLVLISAMVVRTLAFITRITISSCSDSRRSEKGSSWVGSPARVPVQIALFLAPFHLGIIKYPLYTLLRYLFHLCLFIAPIWYSSHVFLLSDSMLGWSWEPLSDVYVDRMTLIVLIIGAWFLFRRWYFPDIRETSSPGDVIIITITLFPFLTGFILVNRTLAFYPPLESLMWYLHIAGGAIMMIMGAFLFVRTRLRTDRCLGCASCSISCPTGTLAVTEGDTFRRFFHAHYLCICCGACVATCPEDAAMLRHEVGLGHFFSFFGKKQIREVDLNQCAGCHEHYIPDPQMAKISNLLAGKGVNLDTLAYCQRCRKLMAANKPLPLS